MAVVEQGSRVRLSFSLQLEDGTVVEEAPPEDPVELIVGQGEILPALEEVLLGMAEGERRQVRLAPAEAFGPHSPDRIQTLERDQFPAEAEPAEGLVIEFTTPSGESVPGTVLAVDGDSVRVDFNHPLAGRAVVFEARVIALAEAANV